MLKLPFGFDHIFMCYSYIIYYIFTKVYFFFFNGGFYDSLAIPITLI